MKYPLYQKDRVDLRLPSDRPIAEFSLENLESGRLSVEDLGIHEDTLRRQARIAEEAGFAPLARNLERAAELTQVPAETILGIYEALRRQTPRVELEAFATEIEQTYGAKATAAFIREAASGLSHPRAPTGASVVPPRGSTAARGSGTSR